MPQELQFSAWIQNSPGVDLYNSWGIPTPDEVRYLTGTSNRMS
jgi:hypothetical protein